MAESMNEFIAGGLSGGIGVLVGSPLDVVKVRLQTESSSRNVGVKLGIRKFPVVPSSSSRTMDYLIQLVKTEGVTSLFRGAASPVLSVAGINSILFVTYSNILALLPVRLTPHLTLSSSSQAILDPSSPLNHPLHHIAIAGLVSGLACFLISTPSELIKCRAQIMRSSTMPTRTSPTTSTLSLPFTKAFCNTAPPLLPNVYSRVTAILPPHSSLSILLYTIRSEGFLGLYRGGTITILREGPGYAIYFYAYEGLRRLFRQVSICGNENEKMPERAVQLCAGGLAGVISWASIYPLDVLKSRVQTATFSSHSRSSSLLPLVLEIYRREGLTPFVKGMKPTLVRAFYVNAVTFVSYEWLTEWLGRREN